MTRITANKDGGVGFCKSSVSFIFLYQFHIFTSLNGHNVFIIIKSSVRRSSRRTCPNACLHASRAGARAMWSRAMTNLFFLNTINSLFETSYYYHETNKLALNFKYISNQFLSKNHNDKSTKINTRNE